MKRILSLTLVLGLFLFTGIALAGNVTYTYDDAGRLVKADYGDGKSITYSYDNAGNLLSEKTYVPAAPELGSLTPPDVTSKAGTARTFSAVYKDANEYTDLKTVDFLVTKTDGTANAIYAKYAVATDTVYLYGNTGKTHAGSCHPGDPKTLQNAQGALDCAGTSVSGSGNNLTVIWKITPKAAFASSTSVRKLKMQAADKAAATTGWVIKGSWKITP